MSQNRSAEAVLSVRDNGFTTSMNNALKMLEDNMTYIINPPIVSAGLYMRLKTNHRSARISILPLAVDSWNCASATPVIIGSWLENLPAPVE